MSCAYGDSPCNGPSLIVVDRGEEVTACFKHVTIENIFRKMKGEEQLRRKE